MEDFYLGVIYQMDKHKDFEIILGRFSLLKWSKEVMQMAENDPALLNTVYQEIRDRKSTRLNSSHA